MKTYICLLRGINVSGQKLIKMADLRVLLESLKFKDVSTYIQSGNIIFKSEGYSTDQLKAIIEKKIESNYSFYVATFVYELEEFINLSQTRDHVPDNFNHELLYFVFLSVNPGIELFKSIEPFKNEFEQFWDNKQIIYLHGTKGYGKAKMNTGFFEKKLKVDATARNWNTVNKLITIADTISQTDKNQ